MNHNISSPCPRKSYINKTTKLCCLVVVFIQTHDDDDDGDDEYDNKYILPKRNIVKYYEDEWIDEKSFLRSHDYFEEMNDDDDDDDDDNDEYDNKYILSKRNIVHTMMMSGLMRNRFRGHVTTSKKGMMMMMMSTTTTNSTDTPMRAMLIGAPGSGKNSSFFFFETFSRRFSDLSLSVKMCIKALGQRI